MVCGHGIRTGMAGGRLDFHSRLRRIGPELGLDPKRVCPRTKRFLGFSLLLDFERAYAEARELVEGPYADERVANQVLALSAAYTGRYDEAIAIRERFPGCDGGTHALAGRREEAPRCAREMEAEPSAVNAEALAGLYAALGDREKTLQWLEYEPANFSLPWGWAVPTADAFLDDPRLRAVFRKMNLEFRPGQLAPVPIPVVHPELMGVGGSRP